MVEESNFNTVVNVDKWLKENEDNFKPPVCNSIMAGGFLKIMFVGGPNTRKDYHLDQGEEFFYMIKGDMCLKVMEKGEPKDIHIREGEVFRLPSRVPHSPQRMADTLGLVIERERTDYEYDGLRYFCEDDKTILWQKFFHLTSLVKDFPPVIKEYMNSEQYKTGIPIPGTTGNEAGDDVTKFVVDKTTTLQEPFNLDNFITENINEIIKHGKVLCDQGEFKIIVYGEGKKELIDQYESWYWHKKGKAFVEFQGKMYSCGGGDSLIIPGKVNFSIEIEKDAYGLWISMDLLYHHKGLSFPNNVPQ